MGKGKRKEVIEHAEPLADWLHPRYAEAGVAADDEFHVGLGLTQARHEILQVLVGHMRRVGRAVPQHEHLIGVGRGDDQWEVLILLEKTVEQDRLFLAMGRIIVPGEVSSKRSGKPVL